MVDDSLDVTDGFERTGSLPAASVLGVRINPLNEDSVASWIDERIAEGRGGAAVVVQTNVHSLVTAREDPEYRQALAAAELAVPDGMPLVWHLRAQGYRSQERVYGPDLMNRCAALASQRGWRCFLYGSTSDVVSAAAETLRMNFPHISIVGTCSPPFRPLTPAEETSVHELINTARPNLLWVALGGPKQDLWMIRNRDRLRVDVMHGVGAAFDFLAGTVTQAPPWMQHAGLEWFFRLIVEPGRLWRRYTLGNIRFVVYLLHDLLVRKRGGAE